MATVALLATMLSFNDEIGMELSLANIRLSN